MEYSAIFLSTYAGRNDHTRMIGLSISSNMYGFLVVRTFETLSSSYLGIYDQFLNVTLATEMSTLSKVRA